MARSSRPTVEILEGRLSLSRVAVAHPLHPHPHPHPNAARLALVHAHAVHRVVRQAPADHRPNVVERVVGGMIAVPVLGFAHLFGKNI